MKIKTNSLEEKNMARGITIGGAGSGFQAWTTIFYETRSAANSNTRLSLVISTDISKNEPVMHTNS